MKKLFCVSLIKTIANCIVDLMTLKQKLISINAETPDPSDLDPDEYLIGNEKCAEYLGVAGRTVSNYVSKGLLKSVHVGPFACYKKTDVDEAVENVPALKTVLENRLKGKSQRTPSMTTSLIDSDSFHFVKLGYQGWHILICIDNKMRGNQSAIQKLCRAVILAYHKIRPFRVAPTY